MRQTAKAKSEGMIFGVDIGTTSVSGVAVGDDGKIVSSVSIAHGADMPTRVEGVCEQDPEKLLSTTEAVLARLVAEAGAATKIGWTGQMHGVVGVNASLDAVTPFVTWRDRRLYGGRVMRGWVEQHRPIFKCLSVCGYVIAKTTGRCVIDPTFLHAWYLDEFGGGLRERLDAWVPECEEGSMLGDNQAGVSAAQAILPGTAVVNIGTSGQLSVVLDEPFQGPCLPGSADARGLRTERRPYPGGRTLLCRAAIAGGRAWADLRDELGLGWDEMNATDNPRVRECAELIVGELADSIDLSGVAGVIGIGNGLVRNPALRRAVERRFGVPCRVPDIPELAAYGAALHVRPVPEASS